MTFLHPALLGCGPWRLPILPHLLTLRRLRTVEPGTCRFLLDSFSPEFGRRLVQEALDRIRDFRTRVVVDSASLAAFLPVFLLQSDRSPTASARIVSPFADSRRLTQVKNAP